MEAASHSRTSSSNKTPSDQVAAAAASLHLLLREDRLLQQYGLTESSLSDKVAFEYAAALLQEDPTASTKQRADVALQDVERKLALVESLAVKLSRTSPEAVAGHLLRLHGYHVHPEEEQEKTAASSATTTTLSSVRERADRLQRQAEVLENVAKRVEGSLTRGLTRMQTSCTRLERVLTLSSSLKMILRLQFEYAKLQNYDLDDLRDLTRAAASVAVVEDMLQRRELQEPIGVVDRLRPQAQATAAAVRRSAATLLQEQYQQQQPSASIQQLGATLQVYYHLGELPDAVWKAVDHAHSQAESASRQLWNPVSLLNLTEQAKKQKDSRMVQTKLKHARAEAAEEWASRIYTLATQVRNLERVLMRKTDPVKRQVFVQVVAAAPIPSAYNDSNKKKEFSLFALFWRRFCRSLVGILDDILAHEQGKLKTDVAALYPAVRSVSKGMISSLQDSLPHATLEDASSAPTAGILGGSAVLDDDFLEWKTGQEDVTDEDNPQAAASAHTWTRASAAVVAANESHRCSMSGGTSSASLSAVFASEEWKALHGSAEDRSGLYQLQQAFLEACIERLCAPLQYMFPENVTLDDEGVAISSGLSLLPSKYDVQRFDENIRQELSLADPREGGGDLTTVAMIGNCVVSMISQFCNRARNAISAAGEDGYLNDDWSMTEALQHDRKVAAIMHTLANYLRDAPEKTFVAPYRPATLPQHEEASSLCEEALVPALQEIEKMVKSVIVAPLCRAINRRIASVLAKMHHGVYMETGGSLDDDSPAFVQKHMSQVFESIAENHLVRFPPEYASFIASTVASFSVYAFVSNASLVRPLGESARLHITQDLADFELALEQFVVKSGGSLSLSHIDNGKPYAELRAVRQMLFWSGLDDQSRTAQDAARSLLREVWIKDVRPSTVFHYLFSMAPNLLSSPHHNKRMKVEDYVSTLVKLDGSVEDGEDNSWMTVMACCDSYQQRASSAGGHVDGDQRVAQIVLIVGPDLMRRRHN